MLKNACAMLSIALMLPQSSYGEAPNDAQRLNAYKQIRQQGIEGMLNVLQQERACVQAAPSMEVLQSCDQISRQMLEKMQAQQKASWETLKAGSQPENKK